MIVCQAAYSWRWSGPTPNQVGTTITNMGEQDMGIFHNSGQTGRRHPAIFRLEGCEFLQARMSHKKSVLNPAGRQSYIFKGAVEVLYARLRFLCDRLRSSCLVIRRANRFDDCATGYLTGGVAARTVGKHVQSPPSGEQCLLFWFIEGDTIFIVFAHAPNVRTPCCNNAQTRSFR
jgi:hypothetical protein